MRRGRIARPKGGDMTDLIPKTEANDLPPSPQPVRDETMSRWGDDGGTVPLPEHAGKAASPDAAAEPGQDEAPDLTNAELVQVRVRVIALESVLVALLADVTEGQLAKVRTMAAHIAPQDGQTPHPLTTSAASHMLSLLHRAKHWDSGAGR
jgi:hypothetical protein